ncbi:archaemetzincin-2 isoform X3 [Mesocricetus auratus]|uniref:Archaemetzincin-2 n=1 Tax=Mesocricetus auratus TaxID=10036 RepID=A0A3Q0CJK2_MESAU|nr:archaemetzincin-2 isoform X3 [Mesocricetus auratus]
MQVLQHSEHTLKKALISKNPVLMSQYEKLDAGERRLMNEAFQPSSDLFEPITVHSKSDWITSHPEDPQDFEQFFTDHNRKAPCPEKHIIYMQSIGHILAFLKKKKPKDAFCIVGITMIDLYPRDSWNFVFGQASLTDGVGIFSFARYGKDFYSSRYEGKVKKAQRTSSSDYSIFDNYYNPEVTSILLRRSCKTLTHEIGHIFGLRHCQWLACLMQGSNHLEESDRRPLHLCPICLRKLQCAIGFSIVERYKALLRWIDDESNDTSGAAPKNSSDQVNLKKPVEAFKDWREWIIKCIAVLEK